MLLLSTIISEPLVKELPSVYNTYKNYSLLLQSHAVFTKSNVTLIE